MFIKIKKQISYIKHWCHFSLFYAFYNIILTQKPVLCRLHLRWLSNWAYDRRIDFIHGYISNKFSDVTCRYKLNKNEVIAANDTNIWVFWAQGFTNAPDVVRFCNNNLKNCNKNVVNLTMANYSQYIDIPDYIINKLEQGLISRTNFADVLRVSLLAKHGGLWIDSTCFVIGELGKHLENYRLFSCKGICNDNYEFVANGRWNTWCLGIDYPNSSLFSFVRDIFYAYFLKEDKVIDYYMIDYILDYAYNNFDDMRSLIDHVPYNNSCCYDLFRSANKKYDEVLYKQLLSSGFIFKLSYRRELLVQTLDGDLTNYGKLQEEYTR